MYMNQIRKKYEWMKSVRVLRPKIIFVPCDKINWPYDIWKNQIISIVLRFLNLELMFVYIFIYIYIYIYVYPVKEKGKELRNDSIQTKFEIL